MRRIPKRLFILGSCLTVMMATSFAAADVTEQSAEAETKKILVVETTDIHGWIMDSSSGNQDEFQYRLAYIANAVNDARESGEYDDVLLLDGGDIYQGPPVSNLTFGAGMRAAMDTMDYDAVCLGNHEFDWDVTQYCADAEGTVAPYELGDYAGDPDIPVLAADLYDAETGERVSFTQDYTVVEKAGLRIAVIGYIPDYSGSVMTKKIAPYMIDDDLDKLDALVRQVNETEKPDATVILAHGEPDTVAEAMDSEQVDLVLGGHTHKFLTETASNGIPYMQGYCFGKGYVQAVMLIAEDGSVSVEDMLYVDLTEDEEALLDKEENLEHLDETVLDISYTAWNIVYEEMSEVLGYVDTSIIKENDVGANSAGNWLTWLMLKTTEKDGAIAAFYNNGGIRADLKVPEGEDIRQITVNDIYTISPFGNRLLVFDLTGAELAQELADGLKNPNYGDQMTGLTFTYSATGTKDMDRSEREYIILSITLDDGTQVDPGDKETLYRVCTSSYSATLENSVFEGKEPVVPEVDAPIDHESYIEVLREMREEGDGYIPVDSGSRGVEVEETDAAA